MKCYSSAQQNYNTQITNSLIGGRNYIYDSNATSFENKGVWSKQTVSVTSGKFKADVCFFKKTCKASK